LYFAVYNSEKYRIIQKRGTLHAENQDTTPCWSPEYPSGRRSADNDTEDHPGGESNLQGIVEKNGIKLRATPESAGWNRELFGGELPEDHTVAGEEREVKKGAHTPHPRTAFLHHQCSDKISPIYKINI